MQNKSGAEQSQKALERESPDLKQPPLSYPVAELPSETGVSRSKIYEEIRKGRLLTFKIGGRRFARHEAVINWLTRLEVETNRSAA